MSFEIVYTSVRRGLRTGSKGFCTVAATEGIPRALHEKLESLSGYSHHEAAAGANAPVNYSHLVVRVQRTVYHVLSRVGDAGKDYSGRTNKIAHHLALTTGEAERYPDGPASLFSDEDFWFDSWHDEPEELSPGRLPEAFETASGDFSGWEEVFGDAGWAGVLGQIFAKGMKPVSVIVPNAGNTMDLLTEALQLIPPNRRWRLCFSTYFSRQAPGTECHWKFVLDRTQEARRLRARSMGGMVDHSNASAQPPEGNPYVEAARNGSPLDVHNLGTTGQRRSSSESAPGGVGGSRRPTRSRRRSQTAPRRRRPPTSPFDIGDNDDDEDGREEDSRKRWGNCQIGVWVVLVLSVAVMAILVFFGIQQLS